MIHYFLEQSVTSLKWRVYRIYFLFVIFNINYEIDEFPMKMIVDLGSPCVTLISMKAS